MLTMILVIAGEGTAGMCDVDVLYLTWIWKRRHMLTIVLGRKMDLLRLGVEYLLAWAAKGIHK